MADNGGWGLAFPNFRRFFSWHSADEARVEGSGDPPPKKEKKKISKKHGKFIFKNFKMSFALTL